MKISTKILIGIIGMVGIIHGMQQPVNIKLQEELNAAAKAGDITGINMALEKGAKLNGTSGPMVETALHAAAEAGQVNAVAMLLDKTTSIEGKEIINPNSQDAKGSTPLQRAIAKGRRPHFKILELFVQHKDQFAPNLRDNAGNTILHIAVSKPGTTYGEHFIPKILEMPNVDINAQNNQRQTPLHIAIEQHDVGKATLLISKPDIDLKRADQDGNTALHIALKGNVHVPIVKALIEKDRPEDGSLVNIYNKAGLTPLHIIVQTMDNDETHFIKEYKTEHGPLAQPPLDEALSLKRDKEAAALLLQAKANPALTTKDGKTALDLAEGDFTKRTIRELIEKA